MLARSAAICALALLVVLVCMVAIGALDTRALGGVTHSPSNPLVASCTPCHGANGEGTKDPYFPRLAGLPETYFVQQMLAFRDRRRSYGPMNAFAMQMADDQLVALAAYYGGQMPLAESAVIVDAAPDLLRRGQLIATDGLGEGDVPACASCHQMLARSDNGIPSILGLRAAYISVQLIAMRDGRRVTTPQMASIAQRLAPADVEAVAAWLARQTAYLP